MSDAGFADRLAALCARELSASRGNADRVAEMIERLTHSLSFTIAVFGAGDAERINTLLEGTQAYLWDVATTHTKIVADVETEFKRKAPL